MAGAGGKINRRLIQITPRAGRARKLVNIHLADHLLVASAKARPRNYQRAHVRARARAPVNTVRMNKLWSIIVYTEYICRANKARCVWSCILHEYVKPV